MPLPLSPTIGLGMKVAVLPLRWATFLMTYFIVISSSAFFTSELNLVPISHWPALATSWWCTSTSMPTSFQRLAHLGAQVVQRVERRDREVAALHARTVAGVAAVVFAAGVPVRFFRIDVEEGVAHVVGEAHRVEDEEFRLRAEERLVGDAAGLEEGLGALGDAARIARVGLHGGRVEDVAGQDQGRVGGERIEERGAGVGQQHHVGLVDALPAGDRGAVEHLAVLEQARLDDRLGEGHVVLHAAHVGEAQVDEFDLVVLDQLFDVFERHGYSGTGDADWEKSAAETVPVYSKAMTVPTFIGVASR